MLAQVFAGRTSSEIQVIQSVLRSTAGLVHIFLRLQLLFHVPNAVRVLRVDYFKHMHCITTTRDHARHLRDVLFRGVVFFL